LISTDAICFGKSTKPCASFAASLALMPCAVNASTSTARMPPSASSVWSAKTSSSCPGRAKISM
jgi:hypothetical protein